MGVCPHVLVYDGFLTESFPTYTALERLLSRVLPYVNLQMGGLLERLAALLGPDVNIGTSATKYSVMGITKGGLLLHM